MHTKKGTHSNMQAHTVLEDEPLLGYLITTSLGDGTHDWRLLPLVNKRFLAAWNILTVPVLRWRVSFLENTVLGLEDKIDDIKAGCSCGYAVGYHFC
jgi:hypothetical protein